MAEVAENDPPRRGADTHRIVLVTGLSGAGKSTATKALEDLGFFCIDNLPIMLLPKLLELVSHGTSDEVQRLAIVVDAREGRFLDSTPGAIEEVRREGHQLEVVFFDCADDVLIRRFSETRRRHPLSPDGSVEKGIAEERRMLAELRALADQILDTSRMNVHELRDADVSTLDALRSSMEKGALVLRTLAELCVEKGVVTREEFKKRKPATDPIKTS